MSDNETNEGYNKFIKEFGLKYKWDNVRNPDEWRYWDDLFCTIKTYWKTKTVRHWKKKVLKQFVYTLFSVKNLMSLFRVFLQSDTFYLSQILSLIKLLYYLHEFQEKI